MRTWYCKKCERHWTIDKHIVEEARKNDKKLICPDCRTVLKLENVNKEQFKKFLNDPFADHHH